MFRFVFRSFSLQNGFHAVVLLLLTLAMPFTARAASYTYTAGSYNQGFGVNDPRRNSNWHNEFNWEPQGIPGAGDSATITGPGDTTVFLTQPATVQNLTLSGGAQGSPFLTGGGSSQNLTVTGICNWSKGEIGGNGFGNLSIPTGGTVNLLGADHKQFSGVQLDNAGTINWSGTGHFRTSKIINNSGLINITAETSYLGSTTEGGVLNNSGILRRSAGTGLISIAGFTGSDSYRMTFNNTGKVEVKSGTVQFHIGRSTGIFSLSLGTELLCSGGQQFDGNTISGAGAFRVSGGSNEARGTITRNGGPLELTGQWVGGFSDTPGSTATYSGTGTFSWKSGSLPGTWTWAAGSLVESSGDARKDYEGTLTNKGTFSWLGGGPIACSSSTFVNEGVFNCKAAGLFLADTYINGQFFDNRGTLNTFAGGNSFDDTAIRNSGVLNIGGTGVGTLSGPSFQQTATGKLRLDIAGTDAAVPQFDQVKVGNATLDGALHVSLINGYTPATGTSFTVITGNRNGGFASVTSLFAPIYNSGSVTLTRDETAPVVSVSSPTHNEVIKRIESISGTASDNVALSRVIVFLRRFKSGTTTYEYWAKRDGTWAWGNSNSGFDTTPGAGDTWSVSNTSPEGTQLPSGSNFLTSSYQFYAQAFDTAGNAKISSINKVTVDTTAPASVVVTTPAHNAVIKGLTSIRGTAADGTGGSGIARVVAYLRRFKAGSTTTYEYWAKRDGTWGWGDSNAGFDTVFSAGSWSAFANSPEGTQLPSGANLATGSYQFYAIAYDKAATFKISSINKVTVDNIVPSSCIVTSPGKNATISSLTVIKGTASDASGGSGIARVDAFLRRGPSSAYQYWAKRSGVWGWGASVTPIPTTFNAGAWRVDNTTPAGTQLPTGSSNLPAGTYQVFAKAFDKADNALLSAINTFSVVSGGSEAVVEGPVSSVVLSSASAQASSRTIRLVFSGAVDDAAASDPSRYSVTINGAMVAIESVQIANSTTVALGLEEGSVSEGDTAVVTYAIHDSHNRILDGTAKVVAR